MDISAQVVLASTLKPGTVYLMNDDIFQNLKPHYVVVINQEVNAQTILLLVVATSKILERKEFVKKRGLDPATLVETDPTECKFLTVPTIFNGNTVLERDLDDIIEKIDNGKIKAVHQIKDELLVRIREAVKKSKLVERRIKKQLP